MYLCLCVCMCVCRHLGDRFVVEQIPLAVAKAEGRVVASFGRRSVVILVHLRYETFVACVFLCALVCAFVCVFTVSLSVRICCVCVPVRLDVWVCVYRDCVEFILHFARSLVIFVGIFGEVETFKRKFD